MKTTPLLTILFAFIVPVLNAQDEERIIYHTAAAIYPHDSESARKYQAAEKAALEIYRDHGPTAKFPISALNQIRDLCARKHPTSMRGRLAELRKQKAAYLILTEGKWAGNITTTAKKTIERVSAARYDVDYVSRYQWAVEESLAFERLQKLDIPEDDAKTYRARWGGSYQNQLSLALGIRPD